MPLVSVIVNAHNGARTLAQTLDSVAAQQLQDREIIFWDDASSDDTAAIAQGHAAQGLRYHRTPGDRPLGLGAARQAAIEVAQGDWIAFIDQDDLWLPGTLAAMVAAAGDDPAVGMVYGRAVRFWPDGREVDFDLRHEFTALPEGRIFDRLFTESCFICISAAMFRRSAVLAVGPIPAHIRIVPDYFLFLEIAHRWQVRAVQGVVCRYRMHLTSMSHATRGRMQEEIIALIDRWQPEIGPELAGWRRQVHATVLAVEELRRAGLRRAGWQRLLRQGSLPFLLSRPVVWLGRALHRRLVQPQWRRQVAGS
jgi:glycosyltransferase involved in cell wall biosynthesis